MSNPSGVAQVIAGKDVGDGSMGRYIRELEDRVAALEAELVHKLDELLLQGKLIRRLEAEVAKRSGYGTQERKAPRA